MATINVYLSFKNLTEEAFNFYKAAFGTEFMEGGFRKYKDMPGGDKMPAADQNLVMHVALPVGNGNVLMGSDIPDSRGYPLVAGNNCQISINADSKEEADSLFNALTAGGKITMPIADSFWGAYFGMFTDKFGINWMVNFDHKQKK